jgi:AraC-like DNA-binding protein
MTDVALQRPHFEGDLLSQILSKVRSYGELIQRRSLRGGAEFKDDRSADGCLFVVTSGEIRVRGTQGPPQRICTGDLVFLSNSPGPKRLEAAPEGAELLFCRLAHDVVARKSMVVSLPRLILITRRSGVPWLDNAIDALRLGAEDDQPGARLVVTRLVDLILVQALRTLSLKEERSGWLSGLSDPRISRAISAIHSQPSRRWSIEELAGEAGMSRSSFYNRFNKLVGCTPSRYCIDLRLTMARDTLLSETLPVGCIGLHFGYKSEEAFSRAYKAMFGRAPADDRKIHNLRN